MEIERKRQNHVVMDIAPLVDVVFLLLLFFIMTSRIVSEPAIHIKLPESKTATIQQKAEIGVSVTKDGRIFIEDIEVEIEEVQSTLNSIAAGSEGRSVRIKADKETALGLVVRVIDEVRLCDVSSFNIVTDRM